MGTKRRTYKYPDRAAAERAALDAEDQALRFGQALSLLSSGFQPPALKGKWSDGSKYEVRVIPSPRGMSEGVVLIKQDDAVAWTWKLVEDYVRECRHAVANLNPEYASYSEIAAWLNATATLLLDVDHYAMLDAAKAKAECAPCGGTGRVFPRSRDPLGHEADKECSDCHGEGEVDAKE